MTMTEPAADPGTERKRWLGPLGFALDWRIARLQRDFLRGSPGARAELARLRRGLGKQAGSVPEIWELTVGAVPADLTWERDEPSRAEEAAHAALTLYALHQQSFPGPAHVPGISFGSAVGRLAVGGGPSQDAVTRRFMAVATAESADEVLVHVRGLVTQLRGERRAIDYARFADDILGLLTPGRETKVRLRWGRDFYRTTSDAAEATTPDHEGSSYEPHVR
jgi:CRISPR system Cascade subunit CasB